MIGHETSSDISHQALFFVPASQYRDEIGTVVVLVTLDLGLDHPPQVPYVHV